MSIVLLNIYDLYEKVEYIFYFDKRHKILMVCFGHKKYNHSRKKSKECINKMGQLFPDFSR